MDDGRSDCVDYVLANIFDWRTKNRFDFVFFAFWLSHVPPSRFDSFWRSVRQWLRPGARAFFVDSARHEQYAPVDQTSRDSRRWVVRRDLADGQEFNIVKVFYDPRELSDRLQGLGFVPNVRKTEHVLVYGEVS